MDLRDTYNKIAEDWHSDHQADTWWVEGTEKFISLLPRGASVLDVGCGGGFKSRFLLQKGLQVTGIDFSEKLIAIARREVPEAEFLVADMRKLDHLEKQFDGIFIQASLLHIPKKEVAPVISGLAKLLKSGGLIYIAVKGLRPGNAEEETVEERDYGYSYKRFFSYFGMHELREHFSNLGVEVAHEQITTAGKTDWLQIIGRKI